jgi:hypothetical protein
MISIVCVFNDRKVLDEYLLKSLKIQTVPYELILIDNTNKQFLSAPAALNYGGKNAKGDYLMFVHQDVDLSSDNWLANIEESLNSLYNLGAAGVAGKSKDGLVSNIKHGIPPILAGTIHINNPTKAQTLDECLFIIPKPVFNNYKFDEETCNDWHLYAVEYCLRVKKLGLDIFVLPNYIYHASAGYSISKSYFFILEDLLKNYKNDYTRIYTTVWNWNSSYSFYLQKVWYLIRLRISNFRRYLIKKWGIWEYH